MVLLGAWVFVGGVTFCFGGVKQFSFIGDKVDWGAGGGSVGRGAYIGGGWVGRVCTDTFLGGTLFV